MRDLSTLKLERNYQGSNTDQDVLEDFYIPVLKYATRYDRLSGFFSPKSFIVTYSYIFFSKNSNKSHDLPSASLECSPTTFIQKFIASVYNLCPVIIHAQSLD